MRLLIVGDLHANGSALDAISETADDIVVLGDLVDYGPDPGATVAWVRAHASWVVRGNHDHAVAAGAPTGASSTWADLAEASASWTRDALSAEERAYLGGLPLSVTFTFGGARFAAFHAAPSDPLYRYLPPETDEATWRSELEAVHADWLLLGHTHRPIVRRVGETTIVNPGSVGQPRAGAVGPRGLGRRDGVIHPCLPTRSWKPRRRSRGRRCCGGRRALVGCSGDSPGALRRGPG